jgi:hypothetical protein
MTGPVIPRGLRPTNFIAVIGIESTRRVPTDEAAVAYLEKMQDNLEIFSKDWIVDS